MPVDEIPSGLRCEGQLVPAPAGRYDWLHLLLDGAEPGEEVDEVVWLHYENAVDPEWLRTAAGEPATRLPVTRTERLVQVRLPERPGLRVVAMTPAVAAVWAEASAPSLSGRGGR